MYEYEAIPFYKAYPLEPFLNESKWFQREKEQFLSYVPKQCHKIQRAVEDACDKIEYEGSWMYHEYPDKNKMKKLTEQILADVEGDDRIEELVISYLCHEMLYRRYRFRRGKQYIK